MLGFKIQKKHKNPTGGAQNGEYSTPRYGSRKNRFSQKAALKPLRRSDFKAAFTERGFGSGFAEVD